MSWKKRSLSWLVLAIAIPVGCRQEPGEEFRSASEIIDSNPAGKAPPAVTPIKPSEPVTEPAETTSPAMASPAPTVTAVPAAEQGTPAVNSPAERAPTERTPAENTPAERTPEPGQMPVPGPKPEAGTEPAIVAMPADGSSTTPAVPTGPLPIKLLIPEKEFFTEGSEKSLRITFDDIDLLKVLNMEPVPEDAADHFPDWLKNLNGKKVILRGWMFPPARPDGISRFMFVRDNGICCFGRAPKIYDKLGVTLRNGVTTRYIQNRPFDVIGTLLIEPEIDPADDGASWIYFLEDAVVIDNERGT